MEPFDHQSLELLISSQGGPHVTIHLPKPDHPFEAQHDSVRMAKLLHQANSVLINHWMSPDNSLAFLKPIQELSESNEFQAGRRCGLAIYLSPDLFKVYLVSEPLRQQVMVSRAFQVRPMIHVVEHDVSFYVLTLSQNRVALFDAKPHSIKPANISTLPESLKDERMGMSADRGEQSHAGMRGGFGRKWGVFHGQGGVKDTAKSELHDFLLDVDQSVRDYIEDKPGYLVLACVDYLAAIFREVHSSPNLVEQSVSGNVDHLTSDQLLQKTWPLVFAEIEHKRDAAAQRIREWLGTPKASVDPEQILRATYNGQIDTLFFDEGATLCGSYYPETNVMSLEDHLPTGDPGDTSHDLIEMAIVQTLRHRGKVYAMPKCGMPTQSALAAVFRY